MLSVTTPTPIISGYGFLTHLQQSQRKKNAREALRKKNWIQRKRGKISCFCEKGNLLIEILQKQNLFYKTVLIFFFFKFFWICKGKILLFCDIVAMSPRFCHRALDYALKTWKVCKMVLHIQKDSIYYLKSCRIMLNIPRIITILGV